MIMQLKFCNGFIAWLNYIRYRLKRLFRTSTFKSKNKQEFNDLVEEEDYYLSLSLKEKTEKTDIGK